MKILYRQTIHFVLFVSQPIFIENFAQTGDRCKLNGQILGLQKTMQKCNDIKAIFNVEELLVR